MESFPPGYMDALGFAYKSLEERNPGLVHVSITPFGQSGPWRDYASTELVQHAASGQSYANGSPEREPLKQPGFESAFQAGACAFLGAMTALADRDVTGRGQYVEVSELEASASMFTPQILGALHSGKSQERGSAPLMPCKDGYVSLNVRHDATWEYMWLFFDDPEMAHDPRYATTADRQRLASEIEGKLLPHLARYTMEELFHALAPLRILIGMTQDVAHLLDDAHLKERGFFTGTSTSERRRDTTSGAHLQNEPDARRLRPSRSAQRTAQRGGVLSCRKDFPLEHVRATVLTQAWAGAFTTRLLADMGAEVIQIESLDRIDPWRGGYHPQTSGVYPGGDPGWRPFDRNASYNSVNTGKLGITLDLNDVAARSALFELVSISDIVAENFSARVLPNLGLEYPVLREVNPTVVLLRMPAYGSSGPYSTYMGNGGTIEPMSGISSLLGYEDGPPITSGVMHTDPFSGAMATAALLIALHHRARTGEGQEIDLSQQETSIGLVADSVMQYSMNGSLPSRRGNHSDAMAPHNNYPCRGDDSWVAIAVRSDSEWARLCDLMGRQDLAYDERFQDLASRLANVRQLDELVSEWTKRHTADEITRLGQAMSIPCSRVYKSHEMPNHPQLESRRFFQRVTHPDTGDYPYTGVSWRLSRTPGRLGGPAPRLGEHSRKVLEQFLGMESRVVDRLIARGVTGDTPNLED